MGKGDKKTKRGKIIMGSYGKIRPKKVEKNIVAAEEPKKAKVVKEEAPAEKIIAKQAVVKKAVDTEEANEPKVVAKETVVKASVAKKAPTKKAAKSAEKE